jgi:hypothetical protein
MRRALLLLIAAMTLGSITVVHAGPREYLFRSKYVCDERGILCFRGTMSFDSNPRVVELRARVRTAPGPGLLRIRLAGSNELGHRRISPFEVRVRGTHSEIINHRMIPDHPDVTSWNVELIEFIAEQPAS